MIILLKAHRKWNSFIAVSNESPQWICVHNESTQKVPFFSKKNAALCFIYPIVDFPRYAYLCYIQHSVDMISIHCGRVEFCGSLEFWACKASSWNIITAQAGLLALSVIIIAHEAEYYYVKDLALCHKFVDNYHGYAIWKTTSKNLRTHLERINRKKREKSLVGGGGGGGKKG